ncbi:hypothetical protein CQA66_05110 [Helicobacter aurati]|uniref:Uncharacterized protein n=1 Tax=Helicobacter aurati TaxID=137778 RepID=A0A3D8J4K6_9HELI|nr:hypothetical protein CQA66_05110 [Helicobacter aurati]
MNNNLEPFAACSMMRRLLKLAHRFWEICANKENLTKWTNLLRCRFAKRRTKQERRSTQATQHLNKNLLCHVDSHHCPICKCGQNPCGLCEGLPNAGVLATARTKFLPILAQFP